MVGRKQIAQSCLNPSVLTNYLFGLYSNGVAGGRSLIIIIACERGRNGSSSSLVSCNSYLAIVGNRCQLNIIRLIRNSSALNDRAQRCNVGKGCTLGCIDLECLIGWISKSQCGCLLLRFIIRGVSYNYLCSANLFSKLGKFNLLGTSFPRTSITTIRILSNRGLIKTTGTILKGFTCCASKLDFSNVSRLDGNSCSRRSIKSVLISSKGCRSTTNLYTILSKDVFFP